MRKDAQSAAFALAVFHLRERVAVVALGDAVVEDDACLRESVRQFFRARLVAAASSFFFAEYWTSISLRSRGDGFFGFLQVGVGVAHATVDLFAAHHEFELAIFGFGDFGFGVGNFVLERFVGFVGLDRAALVAIFAGAFFPLLDVELEFLSFFGAS